MVLRNSLLGVDVAEHVQLLLIFSAHAFFLSVRSVQTREFSGSVSVFPHPAKARMVTVIVPLLCPRPLPFRPLPGPAPFGLPKMGGRSSMSNKVRPLLGEYAGDGDEQILADE